MNVGIYAVEDTLSFSGIAPACTGACPAITSQHVIAVFEPDLPDPPGMQRRPIAPPKHLPHATARAPLDYLPEPLSLAPI